MRRGIWAFSGGVVAGGLAVAGAVLFLALRLAAGGFTVGVPAEQISGVVRRQVEAQVRTALPDVLGRARAGLPEQVRAEVLRSFDGIGLRIGEIQINLPPSTTHELQDQVQLTVERAIEEALAGLDVEGLAAELARESEQLVAASLSEELDGHRLMIQPYSWLSIPITVQVR